MIRLCFKSYMRLTECHMRDLIDNFIYIRLKKLIMPDPNIEVNTFNPISDDTIVVNRQEFQSNIDNFHNYHGWDTNPNISHNTEPKRLREWSDIKFIILH